MLETYKRLQANGAIGPMQKIGLDGKPMWDPSGEAPGQLVVRPYQEYPKVVKRWKDEQGNSKELIAHSKSEELKIISERIEEFSGDQRSPLEVERDDMARSLSDQQAINGQLEARLNALMAQVEALTKVSAPAAAPAPNVQHTAAGSSLSLGKPGTLNAEQKAVLNQK